MAKLHNNKGNKSTTETPNVVVRKVKTKTPEGHYRLNGKFFLMRDAEIHKKVFCNKCHAENAVIIGTFRDDKGNTNYVIRCPHHPDDRYHLDETQFRLRFIGVLPEESRENLFGPDGLPTVRSYCRECRGTTGNVVGETPTHWEIKCQCGQHWTENKKAFARKYLGIDGKAPEFIQREPTERNWSDSSDGSEIRQMQSLLKDFNSKRRGEPQEFPLAVPVAEKLNQSEKEELYQMNQSIKTGEFENSKTEIAETEEKVETNANAEVKVVSDLEAKDEPKVEEKVQVTFEVAGIVISFLEGMSVTVDRIDGKVHVVVR